MYLQHAQILVTALADSAEHPFVAGTELAWREPQPGAELAGTAEPADVGYRSEQCGCGSHTDAGNRHQLLYHWMIGCKLFELFIQRIDPGLEGADLLQHR
jgi:hypothetical protein